MRFQPRQCPTVTVVSDITGGPIVINKSDYDADPENYELYSEVVTEVVSEAADPAETAAVAEEGENGLKTRRPKKGAKKKVKPEK